MDVNALKEMTCDEAVKYIKDGMVLGIGTGSTIELLVPKIAALQEQSIYVTGVCTSKQTKAQAESLNIPIKEVNDVTHIDLAIDGADEVDPDLNLIKGGGGALFREKVIDEMADQFIVLVDERKRVNYLGETFKLPVEIDPFNWVHVQRHIASYEGVTPERREQDGEPFVTDNGNYILDLALSEKIDPKALHEYLIHLTGVLETGYFIDCATQVIYGTENGVEEVFKESN
ncbi:ribose 5-phosphate isomerase A [Staphylococcus massiliensis CCUG 55927]|uniref:ribose 5-phosphate isomerase A n=1 Tax=Staphylococcus massiliensis TaxID=555791 RepID=UPI000307A829|nr:ribose 5-phosphate isomerase A [Staphylococcus massiliensis]PNZ99488.1 ribose 5-phosphate isomerase A [Staphylococcus massiliensis CCUG 55927]